MMRKDRFRSRRWSARGAWIMTARSAWIMACICVALFQQHEPSFLCAVNALLRGRDSAPPPIDTAPSDDAAVKASLEDDGRIELIQRTGQHRAASGSPPTSSSSSSPERSNATRQELLSLGAADRNDVPIDLAGFAIDGSRDATGGDGHAPSPEGKKMLCLLRKHVEFGPHAKWVKTPASLRHYDEGQTKELVPPLTDKTCAVVSNSGALLNHEYGAEIDQHDFVVRMNSAPTDGWEKHVGGKQDVYVGIKDVLQEICAGPEALQQAHYLRRGSVAWEWDRLQATRKLRLAQQKPEVLLRPDADAENNGDSKDVGADEQEGNKILATNTTTSKSEEKDGAEVGQGQHEKIILTEHGLPRPSSSTVAPTGSSTPRPPSSQFYTHDAEEDFSDEKGHSTPTSKARDDVEGGVLFPWSISSPWSSAMEVVQQGSRAAEGKNVPPSRTSPQPAATTTSVLSSSHQDYNKRVQAVLQETSKDNYGKTSKAIYVEMLDPKETEQLVPRCARNNITLKAFANLGHGVTRNIDPELSALLAAMYPAAPVPEGGTRGGRGFTSATGGGTTTTNSTTATVALSTTGTTTSMNKTIKQPASTSLSPAAGGLRLPGLPSLATTTGFRAVVLMAAHCKHVDLYEMAPSRAAVNRNKYQYFKNRCCGAKDLERIEAAVKLYAGDDHDTRHDRGASMGDEASRPPVLQSAIVQQLVSQHQGRTQAEERTGRNKAGENYKARFFKRSGQTGMMTASDESFFAAGTTKDKFLYEDGTKAKDDLDLLGQRTTNTASARVLPGKEEDFSLREIAARREQEGAEADEEDGADTAMSGDSRSTLSDLSRSTEAETYKMKMQRTSAGKEKNNSDTDTEHGRPVQPRGTVEIVAGAGQEQEHDDVEAFHLEQMDTQDLEQHQHRAGRTVTGQLQLDSYKEPEPWGTGALQNDWHSLYRAEHDFYRRTAITPAAESFETGKVRLPGLASLDCEEEEDAN
ncbi:unnamed protein product [Amoebophrya sp. A120]|nr:unnamed protein product [Amoebophrya sp. A120]|eukprot:GSA120T00001141001.1